MGSYMVISSGDVSSKWHDEQVGQWTSAPGGSDAEPHFVDVDSWFIIRRPATAVMQAAVVHVVPEPAKPEMVAGAQPEHGQYNLPEGVPPTAAADTPASPTLDSSRDRSLGSGRELTIKRWLDHRRLLQHKQWPPQPAPHP